MTELRRDNFWMLAVKTNWYLSLSGASLICLDRFGKIGELEYDAVSPLVRNREQVHPNAIVYQRLIEVLFEADSDYC